MTSSQDSTVGAKPSCSRNCDESPGIICAGFVVLAVVALTMVVKYAEMFTSPTANIATATYLGQRR